MRYTGQNVVAHSIAALLAGVALLMFFTLCPQAKYGAVVAVNTVLEYPEKPSLVMRNFIQFSGSWILERSTLKERVKTLELANQAMAEKLQKLGVPTPEIKESYVAASVTLRHPEDWWQIFRIDKGANDGVKEGAAVTSDGFLVGRVSEVRNNFAWVEMITSSTFMLAAVVDQTRDLGIITGDDMGHLNMLYVPIDTEYATQGRIGRGMTISTALINDLIPAGLPVGTIIDASGSKEGYADIKLNAGAHLTQLYSVEVYKPK